MLFRSRFSVISSEDFDQVLVVKPLRVKKKKRMKKTGTVRSRAPRASSLHKASSLLEGPPLATRGLSPDLGRGGGTLRAQAVVSVLLRGVSL